MIQTYQVETDANGRVVLPGHPNALFVARDNEDGSILLEPAQIVPQTAKTESAYDNLAGPFYSGDGASNALGGIGNQELGELVDKGAVLRVLTADGHDLYPAFQFEQGAVSERLTEVLAALKGQDGWAVAAWLSVPVAALEGRTPREVVSSTDDLAPVVESARAVARRWSAP